MSHNLFDRLGGRATLEKVHKIFYDKIFADEWMRQYFEGIDQKHIENQQTDFMTTIMGGPKDIYYGRMPVFAHEHVFIDQELYDYRHEILRQSLIEAKVNTQEMQEWLDLDNSFKRALLKKNLDQCKKRFKTDEILAFENPKNKFHKAG